LSTGSQGFPFAAQVTQRIGAGAITMSAGPPRFAVPRESASAGQSLGGRVRALAEAAGDSPAVTVFDVPTGASSVLTWRQLESASADRAGELTRRRLAPDTRPAVLVPATVSTGTVVDLVAVMRAGLTACPVDPALPAAAHQRHLSALAGAGRSAVSLADLLAGPAGSAPSRDPRAAPDEGDWILFTSGSTGLPRPVFSAAPPRWNPQRGPGVLLQRTAWRAGQTQLVLGPLHHAAPFARLMDGLLGGNNTVLSNGWYPELIFDLSAEHAVEWIQLTPVHLRTAQGLLDRRVDDLSTVRAVLHTAAPCPADTKRRWLEALGPSRVFEMYAATEGIGSTLCGGTEWLRKPGTVGRGLLTRIRILGDDGQPLPAGEVGMVYMRSVTTSGAAYDGRDGFRSVNDLGYLDADGYLFLKGRSDDLVIIGGENVHLNEVEMALLAIDGVADAIAEVVPDDVLGVSLRARVVAAAGRSLDSRTVQRGCRELVPPVMVPRRIEIVDDIRRTPAGKLARDRTSMERTP
jgi:bile acid-coenzyme A ligase